jgi:predicted dithiol-disulfide oxidoreductase (DUF899 family)
VKDDPSNIGMTAAVPLGLPPVADRSTFQAELDELRLREKAHTHEGDTIAAARRRLPMVEVDGSVELIGPNGSTSLSDVFEGRPPTHLLPLHVAHRAPCSRAMRRLHLLHQAYWRALPRALAT